MSDFELTVGDLLDFIEKNKIPRDGKVFYQRIEDKYFKQGSGWGEHSKMIEGEQYHNAVYRNKKVDGEFKDKEQYQLMENPEDYRVSKENMELLKEQYIPAFTSINYDKTNLFITAHY